MKKVIALLMAVLMMSLAFSGCGSKKVSKLIIGTNAAFPPYEYYDDNKNIIGIDAEIAALLADKLGVEYEIKDMDFNGIIAAVQSGSVTVGMAGMTVSDERKKSVDFSDSYATGRQVVIVKEDSPIKTIDDLKGKKIGVQEATTGDIYSTDDFGEENIKRYNNGAAAVAALTTGVVDAVIIDNEPAKSFVKSNAGTKILDTEYAVEDYAIAVSKNDTELLKDINKALAELKDDGSIQKIIDKYIKAE